MTSVRPISDADDCAGQALVPTEVCLKFECEQKAGERPKLELKGVFWCCPECGASYGQHAKGF